MTAGYFTSLVQQLCERPARATVSQISPSHDALRAFLQQRLEREAGEDGSFLSQPVFEALFEYETCEQSLESLALVHPDCSHNSMILRNEHRERHFPSLDAPTSIRSRLGGRCGKRRRVP